MGIFNKLRNGLNVYLSNKTSKPGNSLAYFLKSLLSRVKCASKEKEAAHPAITCSKLTIETLEQGVKNV